VPPLTPGTNKKMTEALKASFASWEKEQERLGIPKGIVTSSMLSLILIIFEMRLFYLFEKKTKTQEQNKISGNQMCVCGELLCYLYFLSACCATDPNDAIGGKEVSYYAV
jgi:hypothetical protein